MILVNGFVMIENNFIKTLVRSLNPLAYGGLSSQTLKGLVQYFLLLLVISGALAVLISIPRIVSIPSSIDSYLGSFSSLELTVNYTMEKPILIPEKRPLVSINLASNVPDKAFIMLNQTMLTYKWLFFKHSYSTNAFSEPLQYSSEIKGLLIFLGILILPLMLVAIFIYLILKFSLMIILLGIITFIVMKIIKNKFTLLKLVKIGIIAATPMIIIDTLNIGWNFNLFFIPQIIFIAVYVMGIGFHEEGW